MSSISILDQFAITWTPLDLRFLQIPVRFRSPGLLAISAASKTPRGVRSKETGEDLYEIGPTVGFGQTRRWVSPVEP
jgi:hypothetical protein